MDDIDSIEEKDSVEESDSEVETVSTDKNPPVGIPVATLDMADASGWVIEGSAVAPPKVET